MTTRGSREAGGSSDGRQRLLDAAVRWLETSSEVGLRMSTIAEEAGVTIALITHHFGSREGLIAAAQRVRVTGASREDIAFMDEVLSSPVSAEHYTEQLHTLLGVVLSDDRAPARLSRVAALASAHGRDELRDELGEELTDVFDALTNTIESAQVRGFLSEELDSRAVASFVGAFLFGLVLVDLDRESADWDEIHKVVMAAFTGLFGSAKEQ